ncbi:MAG: hypothetical protein SWH54_04885 [Thermodesulfobacteriota bacterium]|nr:hypothetical protein [Thermodesulfobacteriota bacterium]
MTNNSSFAPLIYGGAGILKTPIGVVGVNRDSYIIFFQGIWIESVAACPDIWDKVYPLL